MAGYSNSEKFNDFCTKAYTKNIEYFVFLWLLSAFSYTMYNRAH